MRNYIWIFIRKLFFSLGFEVRLLRIRPVSVKNLGSKFDQEYLIKFASIIERNTLVRATNLLEVGANLGQDSAFLAHKLLIAAENVYCFEPILEYSTYIKDAYGFNIISKAVSDSSCTKDLYLPDVPSRNLGSASLFLHKTNSKLVREVSVTRLDDWMHYSQITEIDILKIDVEGSSFEVLKSLGKKIKSVKIIQLETESVPIWSQTKVEQDIFQFLSDNSFIMLDYSISEDGIQADSIWAIIDVVIRKVYDLNLEKFLPYSDFKRI